MLERRHGTSPAGSPDPCCRASARTSRKTVPPNRAPTTLPPHDRRAPPLYSTLRHFSPHPPTGQSPFAPPLPTSPPPGPRSPTTGGRRARTPASPDLDRGPAGPGAPRRHAARPCRARAAVRRTSDARRDDASMRTSATDAAAPTTTRRADRRAVAGVSAGASPHRRQLGVDRVEAPRAHVERKASSSASSTAAMTMSSASVSRRTEHDDADPTAASSSVAGRHSVPTSRRVSDVPSGPTTAAAAPGPTTAAPSSAGARRRASGAGRSRRPSPSPPSTSPGPTPAKHTHRTTSCDVRGPVHRERRCAPSASRARAHASPNHHDDAMTSSSHNGSRRGTHTSSHTWAPGATSTAPPPEPRRTTSTPARAARLGVDRRRRRCVLPRTTAGGPTTEHSADGPARPPRPAAARARAGHGGVGPPLDRPAGRRRGGHAVRDCSPRYGAHSSRAPPLMARSQTRWRGATGWVRRTRPTS